MEESLAKPREHGVGQDGVVVRTVRLEFDCGVPSVVLASSWFEKVFFELEGLSLH